MNEAILWFWEIYKNFLGISSLVIIAIIIITEIVSFLHFRLTRGKCPKCGNYKFGIVYGGPPKCIKCGWQEENFPWSERHPNFVKNRYHIVRWPEENN